MGEAGMTHFHGVRFYDSTDSLARIVATFLGAGFITSEAALVIATPDHRAAIGAALRAVNFDVEALQQCGQLVLMDARATLDSLMVKSAPDPVRFTMVAGTAIEKLGRAGAPPVRVYDEMVNVLWQDGHAAAAIDMEMLWDRLAIDRRCALLCGHAVNQFTEASATHSLYAQHSHVMAENGIPHPVTRI
jgi:prepilin-type processing-associated H-X9-DG protein